MKHNHDRTEHSTTTVKNPNWLEANQLAMYKFSWEVTRDYQEQIQRVVRTVLEPRIPGSQGKGPNHWTGICTYLNVYITFQKKYDLENKSLEMMTT